MERMQPFALQDVVQILDARLVLDRRIGVGRAGPGFGGVLAALAVHVVQRLGLRVVRLEHVVAQRPRWRDPVLVPQLAEVAFAQAEQGGAIHFGIAADEIVQAGMKRAAVAAVPRFLRLVGGVDEDGLGIPVAPRARQIVAAFQHQDALARAGQAVRERGAAGPAADDDHVVVVTRRRHDASTAPRARPAPGCGPPCASRCW